MTDVEAVEGARVIVAMHMEFFREYFVALRCAYNAEAFDSAVGMNEYRTSTGVVQSFKLTTGSHEIALQKIERYAERNEWNQHERVNYRRHDQSTKNSHGNLKFNFRLISS